MKSREDVIKALTLCTRNMHFSVRCLQCPYRQIGEGQAYRCLKLHEDALELLRSDNERLTNICKAYGQLRGELNEFINLYEEIKGGVRMRLRLTAADRRRNRIMTEALYDRREERRAWLIAAGIIAMVAVVLFVVCPALGETAGASPRPTGDVLVVTLSSGTLNVRDKPRGDVIAELFSGDEVTLIAERGGWTNVYCSCEAGVGWVKSEYLTDASGVSGEYMNSTGGRVRIRDKPDGKAIGWLKKGATVTVTVWRDGWAWVGSGWASGDCLEVLER